MTAVRNQQHSLVIRHLLQYLAQAQSLHSPDLARGVLAGTTVAADAAPRSSRVRKARETVMALETEVSMMATEDVLETCSAGVTIVSSLVFIIILKMIAVRGRHQSPLLLPVEVGEAGVPGAPAASPVVVGTGVETDTAGVLAVLTPRPLRPGYVTHSPANPKHGHPGQNGQHQAG